MTPKSAGERSEPTAATSANASKPEVKGTRKLLTPSDLGERAQLNPGVWDQSAAVKITAAGAEIGLDAVSHAKRLELSFGNAFSYNLTFYNGKREVGTLTVWSRKATHRGQLIKRRPKLPEAVSDAGFDRIKIDPRPDERYSLAGFKLLD